MMSYSASSLRPAQSTQRTQPARLIHRRQIPRLPMCLCALTAVGFVFANVLAWNGGSAVSGWHHARDYALVEQAEIRVVAPAVWWTVLVSELGSIGAATAIVMTGLCLLRPSRSSAFSGLAAVVEITIVGVGTAGLMLSQY